MKKILLLSTLFLTPAAFAQSANVRVNPLGLLIGLFNADIDFKVTDTVTVGPQLSYLNWSLGSTSVKAYGIGARANFYLSGPVFTDVGMPHLQLQWLLPRQKTALTPHLTPQLMSLDSLATNGFGRVDSISI